MTDRRLTPANDRVAHLSLQAQAAARRLVAGDWARVGTGLADLCQTPGGRRDRQLLYGARFLVLERRGGFAFGQAERDGYVGYLAEAALGPDGLATHWLAAPASHLYAEPDIKTPEVAALSLGSLLTVVAEAGPRFVQTDLGLFALRPHLRRIGDWASDPVAVARGFIGSPYLWGGNSRAGIDCSGLVQAAHLACGIACPGDSDLQQAGFGRDLAEPEPLQRGDLLFWKGHVALAVDAATLIHAVGFHMAVLIEPIAEVVARNLDLGAGPVVARKRP